MLLLMQYSQSVVKFYQVKLSQYIHLEIFKKRFYPIQKHVLHLLVMFLVFFHVKEHSLSLPFFFLTLKYLKSTDQLNYFRIQAS